MTQKKERKDNCKSISSTSQFYHTCDEILHDTNSFASRKNDERFRPLLIEHLKNRISQGKFDVSRDEVIKIIKKAANDIEIDADATKKED